MSNPAVTEDASAASDREPSSSFLPTDKDYRLTGRLPDKLEVAGTQLDQDEHIPEGIREEREREKQGKADTGEASAASDSDTAAASEAADTQRREEQQRQKTQQTSESRWAKVTRENRELREKLARAEGRAEGSQSASQSATSRDTSQTSQPAAAATSTNSKPKIDDVDPKTNQPKFKTFAEYEDAKDQWLQDEAVRKFQETSSKTAKEQELSNNERLIHEEVNRRVSEVRKTYPDYDDTMKAALSEKNEHGQDAFFYTKGSHIDGFFLDCDRMGDVMYEIGKNFDQHRHIFARDAQGQYLLNPVRQLRELAKIENSLPDKSSGASSDKTSSTSSAKPVSQAPRPAHQVSGKGAVTKDATEDAVEKGDFESYAKAENARALAKRQRK